MWFKEALWRVNTSHKRVFLTFDDGPVPGVTPWVIEQLKHYGFGATFFCVGDNVRKYPHVFTQLTEAKMGVGNHTFSHLKGWETSRDNYLNDVDRAQEYVPKSTLFRPPHGLIWPWWLPALKQRFHRVVMWDLLSRDYNRALTPQQVAGNVVENIRPGSIIVFHDSLKAWGNLKIALPLVLLWLKQNNYACGLLDEEGLKPKSVS